jgi:formylglycine-generating enzyme required for sulfatase activity
MMGEPSCRGRLRKWVLPLTALTVIGGFLAVRATRSSRLAKPIPSAVSDEAMALRATSSRDARETRVDSRGVEQAWVPPGCFRRGADPAREQANPYETPQHDVCLTVGFWIDRYEVTHASFEQFVRDDGYLRSEYWSEEGWRWKGSVRAPQPAPPEFSGRKQPRNWITWYEAEAYARWRGGRLPTEAQWEYAARGPDAPVYPWGNEWAVDRANVAASGVGRTVDVDRHPNGVSWSGAFSMAGNVREWTADWYDASLYQRPVVHDPIGPSMGTERAVRGGSYASVGSRWLWRDVPPDSARAARRSAVVPTHRSVALGMRVVSSSG